MSNRKVRVSDRVLAVLLSALMVFSIMPVTAFAETRSEIRTDIEEKTFKVGIPTEFTFSTIANDDAGVMVVGTSDFDTSKDPDAVVEYWEVRDESWHTFSGDFGPSTGFPMQDATSKFRVTFTKVGSYTFTASMKKVEGGETLCSTAVSFEVTEPTKSVLTTNIGSLDFVVGKETEFEFTTKANDFANTMVIGTSNFDTAGDPEAIELLQYLEGGKWYDLPGDFGPSSGFPMSDATSRFKVKFKKPGTYTFTAAMKYASHPEDILCSTGEITFTVRDNKRTITETHNEGGVVFVENNPVPSEGLVVKEDDKINLQVTPNEGYQIQSVKVGGVSKTVDDKDAYTEEITVGTEDLAIQVEFVRVYTVTVSYDSEFGEVNTAPENDGGAVTVAVDTDVTIKATPKDHYQVVKVEITGQEAREFSGNKYTKENPYSLELKATQDYTVNVTFALQTFDIQTIGDENGAVSVKDNKTTVDYGEDATVVIQPASGYTIKTATVNDTDVYSSISETDDDTVFQLSLTEIQEDKNVKVTFEACEPANATDLTWNSDDAVRKEGDLYVFPKKVKATFTTAKDRLRLTDSDGKTYLAKKEGDEPAKIEISANTTIAKAEVWYGFGWHEIKNGDASVQMELVFDATKPVTEIEISEDSVLVNDYYNSDVKLNVSATDGGKYSGISALEYQVVVDQTASDWIAVTEFTTTQTDKEKGIETATITLAGSTYNSDDIVVKVLAKDKAGNESAESEVSLKMCSTVPEVNVSFTDKRMPAATGNWYSTRTMTVNLKEARESVFDSLSADGIISIEAFDATGNKVSAQVSASDWDMTIQPGSGFVVLKKTYEFSEQYTYKIKYNSYTNKAGLTSNVAIDGENAAEFALDRAPLAGTLKSENKKTVLDRILDSVTFGLFAKDETVDVVFVPEADFSGVQSIRYYITDQTEVMSSSELAALEDDKWSSAVNIGDDSQTVVYAHLVDNAGNERYVGSKGVIYDTQNSVISFPSEGRDYPNLKGFYNGSYLKEYTNEKNKTVAKGIRIPVTVSDLGGGTEFASGIKKIEYEVTAGADNIVTQKGVLAELKDADPTPEVLKEWQKKDVAVIIDASIKDNNQGNLRVVITATDNAGNTFEETTNVGELNLDVMAGSVSADGAPVTLENGYGWYKTGRSVTVTFSDRDSSFNADAVKKAFQVTKESGTLAENEVTIEVKKLFSNVYSAKATFTGDGKYRWTFDYVNDAENHLYAKDLSYKEEESPFAFTIDREAPHGTVKVGASSWTDVLLKVLTFGLYSKTDLDLTVNASDELSPVKKAYYKYDGVTALNEEALEALYNNNEFRNDPPALTGEQQFTVYVRITDYADNYIYLSSDGHVIDNSDTLLTVSAIEQPNADGIYGQANVKAHGDVANGIQVAISAEEKESENDAYAGIKEIRYTVKSRASKNEAYAVQDSGILYSFDYERDADPNSNGGKLTVNDASAETQAAPQTGSVPTKDMLCRKWAGAIVVDADRNNCCDTVVTVVVTDNAGNETTASIDLDIDMTSPQIDLSYDNNNAKNGSYFNRPRVATVVFTERDHHFNQAAAEKILRDSITAKTLSGDAVKNAYTISWTADLTDKNPDANTHTAIISFAADAHYTIQPAYTDRAGNENAAINVQQSCVAPYDFTVDTTAPTGFVTVNGWKWTQLLETLTFGLYSTSAVQVTAGGADEISPVTVAYSTNRNLGLTKVDTDALEFNPYDAPFTVDPESRFNVYVKVTDAAGNETLLNSDGYIIDTVKNAVSVKAEEKPNENGIYGLANVTDYSESGEAKQGIKVHIDVNETDELVNSGIASIKYAVISERNGAETITKQGDLYTVAYVRDTGDNSNGGKLTITDLNSEKTETSGQTPKLDELCMSWSGDVIVDAAKNNNSKVYIRVTVKDNAGNVTDYTVDPKAELALDIDLTAPEIKVSFDNNTALHEKYFNNYRTATVTITERPDHFNAEKATQGIVVTAKNNVQASIENAYVISGWTLNENKNDPDKSTWTATVDFIKDAQYTFAVAYTDEAGKENGPVDFGKSVAPTDFVIDTPNDMPFGTVSIGSSRWNKFLEKLTFGLFSNTAVDVSATGGDNTSPVIVEYYKSNADEGKTAVELDTLKFESNEPFSISKDEQFNVYVKVTDYAGNVTLLNSDGFIVDTVKSAVKATAVDPANANGIYGPADVKDYTVDGKTVKGVKIHVDANETGETVNSGIASVKYEVIAKLHGKNETTQTGTLYNFAYVRDAGENSNGGSLAITDVNAAEKESKGQVPAKSALRTSWSGDFIVDAAKNNSSDVTVRVTVKDNAGNTSVSTIPLDIDMTAPSISVSYDNNNALNEKYFNAQRTATITITERANHFNAEKATAGIVITAKDVKGKDVADAYVINGWKTAANGSEPDTETHTATVFFKADANYTFAVSYTDQAEIGNTSVSIGKSVAPFAFTVDTVDPYGTVTVNDNTWSKFFDTLTFGLFSNSKATVSATADDVTSPVKIEYFKSNDDLGKKLTDISSLELISTGGYTVGKNEKLFDITKTEQFNVYVRITDKAGHVVLLNSDGFVVDTAVSPVSVTAVTAPNANGIYGAEEVKADNGIKLHIDANDTESGAAKHYSGLSSISYSVSAELQGKMVQTQKETTLYTFSNSAPAKSDLRTNWSGDILIDAAKNNSSKVVVTVTVKDNAGNVNTDSIELDVNLNAPVINVSFDNNEALNETYFAAPRTATVVITERSKHFDPVAATAGIVITAKDAAGNNIENAYEISGWTDAEHGADPDAATHTATISFKEDANYTFAISYTGNSGNPNTEVNTGDSVAPYEFTVDTTVPVAEISVNDHAWDKLLSILTFGLYSRIRAEVKVDATDKTSPFTVEYYKTNDPIVKTANALDALYAEGKFEPFETFTVNTNEQFVVYVKITDRAGNYKYISTDGYIVDLVGPALTLTPDEPNENHIYNGDVNVRIETSDAAPYSGIAKVEYWVVTDGNETQRQTLFNFDYTREEGKNTNNGTLVITDFADGSEKVTTLTGNVPTQAQLYQNWNGSIKVVASLNNSSAVTVYVGVTDNAGNYTEQNIPLDIDVTAPSIKVTYEDVAKENAKDGYYESRTATVEITERANHFDASDAKNGIVIKAVDAKGASIENAFEISSWTTTPGGKADEAVHTAVISYRADANYQFGISYTDKAGNKNKNVDVREQKNPYKFTVDKTAPFGTVTAKSAEGRVLTWSSVVDSLIFGFWSNTKISISGTSDDATSPIQSVEYYMPVSEIASDNTTVLTEKELKDVTAWQTFSAFDVTENTQFTVYLRITDNAGNYSFISTNGLIVDEEHPVEESVAPEISVKAVNDIYSGDVKVAIEVVDPMVGGTYSGLKEVRYAVFDRDSNSPNKPTQSGMLYEFKNPYPRQSDLQQKWTGSIIVESAKNNSNNIQVVVYAMDNSLNAIDNSQKESKSYAVYKIDTTAPVINISYDNNNVDSGTYFKANRTATVTVTERNFDAKDVKVNIKNTDGAIPSVVGWNHTEGTYSKDNATHTATITYSADGDYTFEIEYTDLAGNKCTSVNYTSGTAAATAFTIDKTVPTVSVSYNNNSAQNGNYFNASRTATITINEHNFSTDRINVTMTATDDGAATSLPAVSGWTTNGNTHTATVTFANDALYSFDIAYADLAGNASADYAQDSFYVDNTKPSLEITPLTLNGSANNGRVEPVVTATDTNFDQVSITLIGANSGTIRQLNGSYADIHNGRVFSFLNFAEEKDVDDIYTLSATVTDKAGWSETKSVVFSVNRFGSTYSIDKAVADLNNSYVKTARDVVVKEINANELSNIKITLFKNNETIILTPGSDYKVEVTGGNGQWYEYTYTVYAKNFEDDGVYRISIHSEDAAGNVAENTLDTKDLELSFGVDSTLPTINVNNLEDGSTYALEKMLVQMSISDNLRLTKVTVLLDGEEVRIWTGNDIAAIIEEGGNFTFEIAGDSTEAHNVKIVAIDAAENESTVEVKNFYVTTNLWVRFYTNAAALYGTIAGVVVVAGLIVFLVVRKRRKEDENK